MQGWRAKIGLITLSLTTTTTGCGLGGGAPNPLAPTGPIVMIEGAVEDLCGTIMNPNYRGAVDLGSDGDRIGIALMTFKNSDQGKAHPAEVDELQKKVNELEKLAASRVPVAKQRTAVEEVRSAVASLKAKL